MTTTNGDDNIFAGFLQSDIDGLNGTDTITLNFSSALFNINFIPNRSGNGAELSIVTDNLGNNDRFQVENFEIFNVTGSNGNDIIAGDQFDDILMG